MTTYKYDAKEDKVKVVLPAVKIGHERLARGRSAIAGSGFVVCEQHGTTPWVWVRGDRPKMFYVCCKKCVYEHCSRTTAVALSYLADGSTVHPDGHSF